MGNNPPSLDWARARRGQSFHFAPRNKGESFDASIIRHELRIADQIKAKPGMTVLDAGCGVGGPMRAIAKGTGVSVIGITINDYQVSLPCLLYHPPVPSPTTSEHRNPRKGTGVFCRLYSW